MVYRRSDKRSLDGDAGGVGVRSSLVTSSRSGGDAAVHAARRQAAAGVARGRGRRPRGRRRRPRRRGQVGREGGALAGEEAQAQRRPRRAREGRLHEEPQHQVCHHTQVTDGRCAFIFTSIVFHRNTQNHLCTYYSVQLSVSVFAAR